MTSLTFAAEALGPLGPVRLVAQHVSVVLHRRAAAGGVDHDRVVALERLDRLLRQRAGLVVHTGVQRQRAAAARQARRVHLKALRGEHADGGLVDRAEEHALDAALQEGHRAALLADGVVVLGQARPGLLQGGGGGQAGHRGQARRQLLDPRAPGDLFETERPRGAEPRRGHPQPSGPGEQLEHQPAVGLLDRRPLGVALDLRPCVLQQLVVLDARRTGGHAGHAAQTVVEVLHERARHLLVTLLHQHDAPARGVHLLAPQHVGRAGGKAEAAVHAVVDQLELRCARVVVAAHRPPT